MFRLILVEDEPRILRYLKEKINHLSSDFKVVGMYNNGEDALVELHWTQPHAVITDIRMPVMDGIELIGKVRQKLPDIQCAILSGHDDFSYLREAIKLGITDYLLKPAADEEISDLLFKMKDRLMLNQTLLEREVTRLIVDSPDMLFSQESAWMEVARELFYYGNYVLIYAWSPVGDIPDDFQTFCSSLLNTGEKCTRLPSPTAEAIMLIGVHSWSKDRHLEWIHLITRSLHNTGATSVLAFSPAGFVPIPELLGRCRKLVPLKSRFEGHCFELADSTLEEFPLLLESLQPAWMRLAHFIIKQQKQLFVKEIDTLFAGEYREQLPVTRRGWEKLLLHISHSLHSQLTNSSDFHFDLKQAMEQELTEEVWKLRTMAELQMQVREIWSSYFFRSEQERNLQRDWAKDAKQYINDHFRENISLPGIADIFELHPAYLNRVFKRAFQLSISDYLVQLRMEAACRFIREHPFVLIKDIAEHVGYLDPYYFSKVFKQHTGLSPSDYKNSSI
ncbi:response regulator [Paenibacillus sp. FSL L8-0470]|uniref:response regulator n=1 Tax=Paenibacillus sp. FSL L8-0470 TaxID=2954688 RepID=UPI0030F5CDC7